MALPRDKAWWPRKTIGYGWTWPRRWQGWVVTIGYCVCVIAAAFLLEAGRYGVAIWTFVPASIVMIGLSYWKGEDPNGSVESVQGVRTAEGASSNSDARRAPRHKSAGNNDPSEGGEPRKAVL